jgi:hypothetical protein
MKESSAILRAAERNVAAYSPKDRIDHSIFGTGTIVDINEKYTTIAFDTEGTRKFITGKVHIAPSDTPAPARRVRTRKKTVR